MVRPDDGRARELALADEFRLVSGGGERDKHHSHAPGAKGGGIPTRPEPQLRSIWQITETPVF